MSPRIGSEVSEEPISEINMTPLVDVMLVLLILFMLMVPAATQQLSVRLPEVGAAAPAPASRAQLALLADGSLLWNGQPISAQDWPRVLQDAQLAAQPTGNWSLSVQADAQVPYQRVAQALAEARRSGVRDVQLLVQTPPAGL